jgi:hypothetical protein
LRTFAICHPWPTAALGARLSLSHLSSFRGPPHDTLSLDETNRAVLATSLLAREQCAVVVSLLSDNDAVDTAAWLLRWYPDRARAFAHAMHELAAWQYDDSLTEHWHHVLELLPRNSNIEVSGGPATSVNGSDQTSHEGQPIYANRRGVTLRDGGHHFDLHRIAQAAASAKR